MTHDRVSAENNYSRLYNMYMYIINSKPVNSLLCQSDKPLDISDMLLAT